MGGASVSTWMRPGICSSMADDQPAAAQLSHSQRGPGRLFCLFQ